MIWKDVIYTLNLQVHVNTASESESETLYNPRGGNSVRYSSSFKMEDLNKVWNEKVNTTRVTKNLTYKVL